MTPRVATKQEAAFMRSLKRALKKQPETCVVYFTPNGARLHDISEAENIEFASEQMIDSAEYSGRVDCGDY